MQLSKYNYAFIALFSCSISYAAIPIENVSLSQNTTASLPTIATNNPTSTTDNSVAPVNINWQLMQKSEKLEEEVRRLRGTIEEHENTIQQLKKDLDNHYADLDQRLQLLQQKVDEQQQTQQPTTPTNTANITPTPTASKASNTNQAAPNNTVENTTETKKTDLTEKEAYTLALEAYKQGGAKKAIAPMQDFIKHYPKSIYTGNAHFWLAEFHLAVTPSDYTAAKKNYEVVAKQYPESDKASRALYQLYSIVKEVDHNSTLATTYKQLILTKYPKSKEASYFKTN